MGVPPSEVLLSALPRVAPRIRALLRQARPHRGEWVLPAGPPEVLPLVGSLRQVRLVSPPQAQPHPESPRRGRQAGLLVALPPEALLLVAQPIRESPPPVPQPLGLLASPPQVGQQQEKCQAVESSPQRS